MTILESYIDCMQRGDEAALADLFNEYGVLHDSSLIKAGMDTLHLEGRMAVEMMFHHKFGFNGGPFPIHSVKSGRQYGMVFHHLQRACGSCNRLPVRGG